MVRNVFVAVMTMTMLLAGVSLDAQTAKSLFLKSDGKQVAEIYSKSGNEYKTVGHHGPAVENVSRKL